MKEPDLKALKQYGDPILQTVNIDLASFRRFADVYDVPLEPVNQTLVGPVHKIIAVGNSSKIMTRKGELVLRLGYTFETKKKEVEVMTYVGVERERDMVNLTHDIRTDVWRLRATVTDSGKLIKLLENYGIKDGEGSVELKSSRYLLAARDLICYMGQRRARAAED